MGEVHQAQPVLLVLAAFSRHEAALDWAHERASQFWDQILLTSRRFVFDQTEYYALTMGADLHKQFFAGGRLADPGELPAIKRLTNHWELEYADAARHPELRPLNLDPGYITPAKLVLASTKDFAHRIYVAEGIYAEVTLQYRHGVWQPLPWTFPDYQQAGYHEFFSECRDLLLRQLQARRSAPP